MLKQASFSLLLLVAMITLSGCLSAPGLTSGQVHERHVEAIRTDLWQLQDDIDAFFLFDRPGRMHRLVVR